MDSATQDLLYQKINECVYDEEKIITCASIVRDLKVSLEDAKTLLANFVDDSRNLQRKELYFTYLLSGSLKEGKGLAVYLAKEEDLSEKKSLFEKVSSEVVFSIQKNKPIDFNIIALVDKNRSQSTEESRPGFVIGRNCVKRNIKRKVLPPPPKEINHVKENKSFFQKIASNGALPKAEMQGTSKEFSQSQEKQTKGKSSGMMANFLKSAPKTNGNFKSESKDCKLEDKSDNSKKEEDKLDCNNTVNGKENVDEIMDVDEDIAPQVSQKTNGQDKAHSKKRKKENKNKNTSNKKRKRIQEVCDSDSDDIFESEEKDEDIIEKSDEEPEPIAVMKPVLLPKNKRRKAVDKTFMDEEEGFMVTTTEYIYESASEEEGKPSEKPVLQTCPEKPKPLEKKNSTTDSENEVKNGKTKGKKSSKKTATGKQTTLMNFFKKN